MRHGSGYRKFSRTPAHRRSLFRNMATSLLEFERYETTVEKAKELKKVTEQLIRLAANDNLATRRQAYSYLKSKAVVHKLFSEIGPRFRDRNGGYTRVLRTRSRHGDAAQLAQIELLPAPAGTTPAASEKSEKPAKKASKKAAPKAEKQEGANTAAAPKRTRKKKETAESKE